MYPQSIDIEVDVGDGLIFDCMEEINGFWISFDLFDIEEFELLERVRVKRKLIDDLKWIIKDVKKVAKDLNIQVPHFALACYFNPLNRVLYCIVDKRKEIVYLRLPMVIVDGYTTIDVDADEYDHLIYHELMHAKDCLEGRFPSCGVIIPGENPELDLITSLWHFSIEGRLERSGLPHRSREKVIEIEYEWARELKPSKNYITNEFFEKFRNKLWGKEVTFEELQSLLSNLRKDKV